MRAVVELAGKEVVSVSVFDTDEDALKHAFLLSVADESSHRAKTRARSVSSIREVMRSLKVKGSFSQGDWAVQIATAESPRSQMA